MPTRYPKTNSTGDYLYISALLDQVMEVIPCIEKGGEPSTSVVGLLLRCSNRGCACLGRFRLDRSVTEIPVGGSDGLFLGFARTAYMHPYVASVRVSPPDSSISLSWMLLLLGWTGTLEWWFSSLECRVYYEGWSRLELI